MFFFISKFLILSLFHTYLLINSPSARAKFTNHVVEYIEKHNFDGLDLDWEYPKCWQVDCNKGPKSDKRGFALWVKELKEAFKPKGKALKTYQVDANTS